MVLSLNGVARFTWFFLFRHHRGMEFKGFKLPSCVLSYFLLGCPLFFTEANAVTDS